MQNFIIGAKALWIALSFDGLLIKAIGILISAAIARHLFVIAARTAVITIRRVRRSIRLAKARREAAKDVVIAEFELCGKKLKIVRRGIK